MDISGGSSPAEIVCPTGFLAKVIFCRTGETEDFLVTAKDKGEDDG